MMSIVSPLKFPIADYFYGLPEVQENKLRRRQVCSRAFVFTEGAADLLRL